MLSWDLSFPEQLLRSLGYSVLIGAGIGIQWAEEWEGRWKQAAGPVVTERVLAAYLLSIGAVLVLTTDYLTWSSWDSSQDTGRTSVPCFIDEETKLGWWRNLWKVTQAMAELESSQVLWGC